jgi:preprotein translocase subunit Sec61beta
MAQNKVNMPMSTAGITQYWSDSKSKIEIRPGHVIILCGLVCLIVIFLNAYFGASFGLA